MGCPASNLSTGLCDSARMPYRVFRYKRGLSILGRLGYSVEAVDGATVVFGDEIITCAERLLQGSWLVSMSLLESSALARETVSRDAAGVAAALSAAYGAAYAVRRPSCLHAGAPRGRHACSPARRRRRASSTRCWSAR